MTVLLIDASGHKRVIDIPRLLPVIRVPLPVSMSCYYDPDPVFVPVPIADFVYSDEPSYPPVYRQRLTK